MEPLKLLETQPGDFSLILSDSETGAVDGIVAELGHTPNGYFWEGVARTVIRQREPELEAALRFDCEAGMFCAYGKDRVALEKLGKIMAGLIKSPVLLRETVSAADPDDFDD